MAEGTTDKYQACMPAEVRLRDGHCAAQRCTVLTKEELLDQLLSNEDFHILLYGTLLAFD